MCLFIKPKASLCLFWEVFESSGQKLAFLKSLSQRARSHGHTLHR